MTRSCIGWVGFGALLALLGCGSDDAADGGTSSGSGASATGATGTGNTAATGGSGGVAGAGAGGGGGVGGTPPGVGIASRYPGDVGITNDPDVLFADDFESYTEANDLNDNWDAVYQMNQIVIATAAANVAFGDKALELNVPQQNNELSNATDKVLTDGEDVLFLRYYSKFQPPYDVVGSSHNGSMISAQYFQNGNATPGVPANGTNKFLVNLENWRGEASTPSPGHLNLYVYHPEQRSNYGDHFFPTGVVLPNSSIPGDFGPTFVPMPDILSELDVWQCYEYMVKANTPGERDGRITVWVDGELVADFPNLRFRDVDTLKIDRFGLSFHIGSNPNGATKKWFDNVVAAKSYIGPVYRP